MTQTPREPELAEVMGERRRLINLAYRLLGSLADAEDVVQETYARLYALDRDQRAALREPAAWLTTVATRICLDQLGSARARRERYVGEWLPEPIPGTDEGTGSDPADRITLDESIDMALLVVLDEMTPAQRVAFLLHDVFGYAFGEIGEIVGRSPAACRQLATSARRRVRDARPTHAPPADDRAAVVRRFRDAWQRGEIRELLDVLDADVVMTSDGGGVVPAALAPIRGDATVADLLASIIRLADLRLEERVVNGQPGLVATVGGTVDSVLSFDVTDGRVRRIWAVRNPEKLRPWLT